MAMDKMDEAQKAEYMTYQLWLGLVDALRFTDRQLVENSANLRSAIKLATHLEQKLNEVTKWKSEEQKNEKQSSGLVLAPLQALARHIRHYLLPERWVKK